MLGTSNITTTLVGNELGVATRNVRELCTSTNINIHAANKPTYDITKPSGFELIAKGGGNYTAQYRRLVNGEAHRLGDFRKYNHYANPATLDRVILTPANISTNGQTIDVAFWFNTGEIDFREYGFTHIRFVPIYGGNGLYNQALSIPLSEVRLNSVISNQGGAGTPYTPFQVYTSISPGGSTTLGTDVEYYNSDSLKLQLSQSGNISKISVPIAFEKPQVPYPENIRYVYNNNILIHAHYLSNDIRIPIASTGNPQNVMFVTFAGKDSSITNKFKRSIKFSPANGGEICTYYFSEETPDAAASKVFTYKLGYYGGSWPGLVNPQEYVINVELVNS